MVISAMTCISVFFNIRLEMFNFSGIFGSKCKDVTYEKLAGDPPRKLREQRLPFLG